MTQNEIPIKTYLESNLRSIKEGIEDNIKRIKEETKLLDSHDPHSFQRIHSYTSSLVELQKEFNLNLKIYSKL